MISKSPRISFSFLGKIKTTFQMPALILCSMVIYHRAAYKVLNYFFEISSFFSSVSVSVVMTSFPDLLIPVVLTT